MFFTDFRNYVKNYQNRKLFLERDIKHKNSTPSTSTTSPSPSERAGERKKNSRSLNHKSNQPQNLSLSATQQLRQPPPHATH